MFLVSLALCSLLLAFEMRGWICELFKVFFWLALSATILRNQFRRPKKLRKGKHLALSGFFYPLAHVRVTSSYSAILVMLDVVLNFVQ